MSAFGGQSRHDFFVGVRFLRSLSGVSGHGYPKRTWRGATDVPALPSCVCVEGFQRGRGKNLTTALLGPIHDPDVGWRDSRMLAKRAKAP
jgi:hypothetical protein